MRFLLTLLLVISTFFSSAQINKDSLLIVLLDKSKDTSSRLEALRQYVTNDFLYANPDSAIQIAKMGIDLAEKAEFKNEIAFGFYCLGVANNYLGKTDDAIRYQNQSLEISKGCLLYTSPSPRDRG